MLWLSDRLFELEIRHSEAICLQEFYRRIEHGFVLVGVFVCFVCLFVCLFFNMFFIKFFLSFPEAHHTLYSAYACFDLFDRHKILYSPRPMTP